MVLALFDGFRVRNGLGGFCAGYGFDGVCAGVGCGFAGFYAGDGSNWSRVGFYSCRVWIQQWAQSVRVSCDMEMCGRLWNRFHRHAKNGRWVLLVVVGSFGIGFIGMQKMAGGGLLAALYYICII